MVVSWQVEQGDCLAVLRACPSNVVDALVTDPPSGIGFMGREWDSDRGGRDAWIAWLAERAREALRLLKPGAHGLVWALPRTSHWTATALEDAGFEVRDIVCHLFGTGFPKSIRLGKRGAGTALKPAAEHWILVRKPCDGTTTATFERWGTGGLEIDACRISTDWNEPDRPESWKRSGHSAKPDAEKIAAPPGRGIECHPAGRWPANVVLSHSEACGDACAEGCAVRGLDEQAGERKSGAVKPGSRRAGLGYHGAKGSVLPERDASSGGASRFFYCAKPSPAERDLGLDALPVRTPAELTGRAEGSAGMSNSRAGAGRTAGRKNHHPTVKSIALMRWLVRLVTPPGGVVLDPFTGSGTTGCAAVLEGAHFAGIEQDPEYVTIARARISAVSRGWQGSPETDRALP